MLKQRIITAAVLIPVVLAAILLLEERWFVVAVSILVALAAWEWGALCKLNRLWRYCYSALAALILVVGCWTTLRSDLGFLLLIVAIILGFIYWLFIPFLVVLYQRQGNLLPKSVSDLLLMGLLMLVPMGSSLILLRWDYNVSLLLFLLLLIWSADTMAYFVGKKWGRRPLASRISPGKTWEGTLAGVAAGGMVALVYVFFFELSCISKEMFIGLSLITVCFSVLGDLMESIMKRQASCKDSGSILPGHGGVLDRIDSLTAAAPIFAIGMLLHSFIKL